MTQQVRFAATVYASPAALSSYPGPLTTERYAYVLSLDATFTWVSGNTDTPDDINVIGVAGGADGTWRRVRALDKGTNLTDANATILVSANRWRVLPAATLTTGRTLTLGTTGAVAGDPMTLTRLDTTANTYTVVDGASSTNLCVMPVSVRAFAFCMFDGTNWLLRQSGTMLGAT